MLAAEPTLRELHVGRLARVGASFIEPVDPAIVAALRHQFR